MYDDLVEDTWPESRDAVNFPLCNPVVAHPPCAQWSRLRAFARKDLAVKALAPWAVLVVRRCGGVVEHPYGSDLFSAMGLPEPGKSDRFGFTICVDQFWFGHLARKRTLLYICGLEGELPLFPLVLGEAPRKLESLSKRMRDRTPPQFAEWLIDIARNCHGSEANFVCDGR